ncbi:hypothetical protein D3C83_280670 [compost metagenome]
MASHNREASIATISLVPSADGLIRILLALGFARVERVTPPEGAYEQLARGRRVMLAAWVRGEESHP